MGKKAYDTYNADRAAFQETPEIILQNIAETLQQKAKPWANPKAYFRRNKHEFLHKLRPSNGK
ncbi:MAG: hypothetical protein FWG68_08750 [Defluviitaleaceae bacterium]|nr:hypothetical protein [Defluviitaleaceae bacterium]